MYRTPTISILLSIETLVTRRVQTNGDPNNFNAWQACDFGGDPIHSITSFGRFSPCIGDQGRLKSMTALSFILLFIAYLYYESLLNLSTISLHNSVVSHNLSINVNYSARLAANASPTPIPEKKDPYQYVYDTFERALGINRASLRRMILAMKYWSGI